MYQLVLKVLGVQIDEHLSWNQHIEYIANKIAIVRYWSHKEIKRRFFTESRIVRSKPIRSHGLKHAFTRWRRASFEESF